MLEGESRVLRMVSRVIRARELAEGRKGIRSQPFSAALKARLRRYGPSSRRPDAIVADGSATAPGVESTS